MKRSVDGCRWDSQIAGNDSQRAHGLDEAFNATQAAAGRPRAIPAPAVEFVLLGLRDPYSQFEALLGRNDIDLLDLIRRCNNAFGKAEPDSEILKVARCGHHHRVRCPVIRQCDRRFFWKCAAATGDDLPAPAGAFEACDRRREPDARLRCSKSRRSRSAKARRRRLRTRRTRWLCWQHQLGHETCIPSPRTMRTGTPLAAGTKLPLAWCEIGTSGLHSG